MCIHNTVCNSGCLFMMMIEFDKKKLKAEYQPKLLGKTKEKQSKNLIHDSK